MAPQTSVGIMTLATAVMILFQFTCYAVAQDSDTPYFAPAFSQLPPDLRSYLSAIATQTGFAGAEISDYVTEPDLSDDGNHGPEYSEAAPFIQGFLTNKAARVATATVVPDDQKSIIASIARVVSADAAMDGLLTLPGSGSASKPGATTTSNVQAPSTVTPTSKVAPTATASRGTTSVASAVSSSTPTASTTTHANRAAGITPGIAAVAYGLQLFIVPAVAMFA